MDVLDSLLIGLSLDQMAMVAAAIAAGSAVAALWVGLTERGPSASRARAIIERRQDLRARLRRPARRGLSDVGVSVAKQAVRRLSLMTGSKAREIQVKLSRAGIRSRDALPVFLFLQLVLPAALGGVAAMLVFWGELWALEPYAKLAVCVAAAASGIMLPELYVKNAADKRRQKLSRALPDALDLMVICAESGLNLDSALVRVAREIEANETELAQELELTAIELGFLSDRRQALANLETRTGLASIGALVSTLAQSERYGTPLAQSLRVLAREMRDERMMKAEEKAARLPATLTVPMVVFILPSLFVVLIGPAALSSIDALTNL